MTNPLPVHRRRRPRVARPTSVRLAPDAFRALTFRAVRPEDYAEAAERLPWVQRAGARVPLDRQLAHGVRHARPPRRGHARRRRSALELEDAARPLPPGGPRGARARARATRTSTWRSRSASSRARIRGDVAGGVLEALVGRRRCRPRGLLRPGQLHLRHAAATSASSRRRSRACRACARSRGSASAAAAGSTGATFARARASESRPNEVLRLENDPHAPGARLAQARDEGRRVTCCPATPRCIRRLSIAPGRLDALPRQVGGFPEFRARCSSAVGRKPPLARLAGARARRPGRDAPRAVGLRLRCARLLRRGHRPRVLPPDRAAAPVAAQARRAARLRPAARGRVRDRAAGRASPTGRTSGRPAGGTALPLRRLRRAEPPQVFELDADTVVHPLTNAWQLEPPRPADLGTANPSTLLLDAASAGAAPGAPVLVEVPATRAQTQVRSSAGDGGRGRRRRGAVRTVESQPRPALSRVRLRSRPCGSRVRRRRPRSGASSPTSTAPTVIEHATDGQPTDLVLDGIYREIKPGQAVVLEVAGRCAGSASRRSPTRQWPSRRPTAKAPLANQVTCPAVSTPATKLKLDTGSTRGRARRQLERLRRVQADRPLRVRGRRARDARLKTTLASGDPLRLRPPVEEPQGGAEIKRLLLSDLDDRGLDIPATHRLRVAHGRASTQGTTWTPPLALPVTAWATSFPPAAARRVAREVLGRRRRLRGERRPSRSKKAPLTYLPAPGAAGRGREHAASGWTARGGPRCRASSACAPTPRCTSCARTTTRSHS